MNINNLPEEEQIKFVSKYPTHIVHIDHPSEKVQLAAVNRQPLTISRIKIPTEKVQLVAINKNPDSIYYIDDPCEAVQNLALEKDGKSILCIGNKISKRVLDKNKHSIVKAILTFIANKNSNDKSQMIKMISILDKNKIKWPELDIIKRSLIADRIIRRRLR